MKCAMFFGGPLDGRILALDYHERTKEIEVLDTRLGAVQRFVYVETNPPRDTLTELSTLSILELRHAGRPKKV